MSNAAKPIIKSAPPSPAVVAVLIAVGSICIRNLPSDYNTTATLDDLTTSALLGTETLVLLRAAAACVIFGAQLVNLFGPGWDEDITYPEGSKLKECTIRIKHQGTLMFFTVWSWLVLGLYFATAAYLGAVGSTETPPAILKATLVLWEIAAPNALLVTVVVSYVIWPEILKKKPFATAGLKYPIVLMQHNLNTLFVVSEIFLTKAPLLWSHAAVCPIFGLVYCLFAWSIASHIAPEHGAVYLYFFFDSTQGAKFGIIAHVALLGCLAVFYGLAAGVVSALAAATAASIPAYIQGIGLLAMSFALCRFRD